MDVQAGRNLDPKELRARLPWRDLVAMRPRDGAVECLHPVPWLIASWAFAAIHFWPLAAISAFMFFLTALRLNHEAIHGNLGFSPRAHRCVLHVLSALMLGSNSAVAFNHLQHHRHIGSPLDVEGKAGRMSGWRVLVYGPMFPAEMHVRAWTHGGRAIRRRMMIDAGGNLVTIAAALAIGSPGLFHLAAMVTAQCLTAFFAVWITHHDLGEHDLAARTQRSPLINFLTYSMFFHLEHHLFPAVPVRHLARLAARLDAAEPSLAARARRVL